MYVRAPWVIAHNVMYTDGQPFHAVHRLVNTSTTDRVEKTHTLTRTGDGKYLAFQKKGSGA